MENKKQKAIIVTNLKEILHKDIGAVNYQDNKDELFFTKYAGKTVDVYECNGDWFICEDDNYVLTKNCFKLI